MPPSMDTPSEVATVIVAVVVALGTIVGGIAAALALGVTWWRTNIGPLLRGTAADAAKARAEVSADHGGSMRDALARVEKTLERVEIDGKSTANALGYLRGDMRDQQNANDQVHTDHAARLRRLEERNTTP